MEPKSMKLSCSSLEVPSVQELAKEELSSVPDRYLRPDQQPLLPYSISSLPQIPTVDLQKLLDESSMDSELQLLHGACQQWGFFQLINHGVDSNTVEKMKSEIQGFFNLPIEIKKKFSPEAGDIQGYGQVFVMSEEQKLDWGDRFYVATSPPSLRNRNLIQKLPPILREAIESYSLELKILAMKIVKLMAKAVKMKDEEMEILFEEGGVQAMRMNYYPPCPQPELVTGFRPHSDAVALTILLQLDEINGLQIKKDGIWIPVTPLPDAFVINIGDILEIMTNGSYRSIEHRVTTNSKKERLSVATFFSPKLDGYLGPAQSLISHENPARFRRILVADYYKRLYSKEIVGRSHLDTMRI